MLILYFTKVFISNFKHVYDKEYEKVNEQRLQKTTNLYKKFCDAIYQRGDISLQAVQQY